MPLSTYQDRAAKFTASYQHRDRQLGWLSFIRLIVFLGIIATGYAYLVKKENGWLYFAIALVAAFIYCIRLYDRIKNSSDFARAMATINSNEIQFINGKRAVYGNGEEHIDPQHPYSYDLDLFGEGSLYQYINRTTTHFGKQALSGSLLQPDTGLILETQAAIKELAGKTDFRQEMQALGIMQPADSKDLDKLKTWLTITPTFPNKGLYAVLLLFPLATVGVLVNYFVTGDDSQLNLFYTLFTFNLLLTFSFARKMMKQVSISTAVTRVLQQFAGQLKEIEKQKFDSALLKDLQTQLKTADIGASVSISKLANLFGYLDFIMNLAVSLLLNGLFIFHVHVLFGLDQWRKRYAGNIMRWLDVIGKFESLNSFGTLAFNNQDYHFPGLSEKEQVVAFNMGHPLIPAGKRVNNDIAFDGEKFIVLTGSNMSGKSTFLRTLGINLVLARAGSAVCAERFTLFPYDLHVSMRITDSLQDSESLFYAELKRLRGIISHLESDRKTFIILDEILRGTNSNDKHNGTVGLIRKLSQYHVCGIIATHDLTIADLSSQYPGYMGNRCFESVIVNDELIFDYKLKQGVCTKLNASFLMKRMGIID